MGIKPFAIRKGVSPFKLSVYSKNDYIRELPGCAAIGNPMCRFFNGFPILFSMGPNPIQNQDSFKR